MKNLFCPLLMLSHMASSAIIVLLVLLLCSLLSCVEPSCPESTCAAGEPLIRFPFRLKYVQDEQCGSKGFDLWCNNQNRTVLSLPLSGDFLVSSINYQDRVVILQDPDDCLARRLLGGFSSKGSSFNSEYYRNFTFLKFPSDISSLLDDILEQVPCLSASNYSIFVVPDDAWPPLPGVDFLSICSNKWVVTVPVPWQTWSSVTETIWLKWDGTPTGSHPHHGISAEAKIWILLAALFPWPVCVLVISCYLKNRGQSNGNVSSPVPGQHLQSGGTGMDGLTIELYPKTEVGESGELPRPSDNTCSICLSEYQSKETIRIIPDCDHYFHARCIDPWLKQNGSCPLCRNRWGSTSEPTTD